MMNLPSPKVVIVRRGQFATFELLARTFTDDPSVHIIWDRRMGDRRQSSAGPTDDERRQADRRRTPPHQWGQLHYIVVGSDDTAGGILN